ncbi:TolB family protein [Capilliphycus salinus ALCB114379]|uniref:TolB family protein n=1 Tax=Capilliphycus salinus TaxID=2768948 RepID=UPI002B915CB3|nr:Tol biopolymer transporter periplasmic protein [Lyngbya sp.]
MKRCLNFIIILFIAGFLLTSCVGSPRIIQYPVEGSETSLNSPAAEFDPQISDRYIVFASDRRGRQDIYLYDRQQKSLVDLPGLNSLNLIAEAPIISANGQYIAFLGIRGKQSDIYLYNRETRQLRNLTQNLQAEVRNPTMSGEGGIVAFESSVNGQWDILVYNRYGQPLNLPLVPR